MSGFDQLTQPPGVGRVLAGRYRLVAPIARGGMAEVWEGHDEVLSRPVAVKVLQAHLAADGVFLERFRREAVTAARLGHPGITATFDTGIDRGTAFIVMELVRGRNLRQLLGEYGRLEPWQAVAITRQVADALAYAHQAGLVHRDVKPANILLVEDDLGSIRVKVTDFGIAKAGMSSGHDLTRTGMVLGTPKYLSPEQIRGVDPDPRADLYSLGVVLYEMLVGEPPYVGENDMATALAHLNERAPKPSASVRGIPGGLDRVVTDLLAKNPDRRIQSGTELRQRLDALGPLAPLPGPGAGGRQGDSRRGGRRRHEPVAQRPPRVGPIASRPAAPGLESISANGKTASPPGVSSRAAPPFAAGPPPPPPGLLTGDTGAGPSGGGLSVGEPSGGGRPGPGGPGGVPVGARAEHDVTRVVTGGATSVMGRADARITGQHSITSQNRPDTDQLAPVRSPARRFRRSERAAGFVVLGLVVVGIIVAATLLSSRSHGHGATTSSTGVPSVPVGKVKIASVTVFMNNARVPDNPGETPFTFDGDPTTYWQTDRYGNPTFGNLYSGIGLEIELSSNTALHSLVVSSSTQGWAASAYVSKGPVPSGQALTAWGPPTDSKSAIAGGAEFGLGGHKGRYVLLWITNLGPGLSAQVAELAVS